jgi:hypothetical protein
MLLKSGMHHHKSSLMSSGGEGDNILKIIGQLQPEQSGRHEPQNLNVVFKAKGMVKRLNAVKVS